MQNSSQFKIPLGCMKTLLATSVIFCVLQVNTLAAHSESADKLIEEHPAQPALSELVTPRIEISACAFSQQFDKYKADCGTLYVRENHVKENHVRENQLNENLTSSKSVSASSIQGKQRQQDKPISSVRVVSIPIIIFHPEGEVTGDPVVVTGGGGPGSAIYIMKNFDGDPDLFFSGVEASTLKNGRQLILMEMRGTGESEPNLDCPAMTELEIDFLTTSPYKWDNKAAIQTLSACAKAQKSNGIDGNFYNTDSAIQDIDALRTLLNIDKWHLLGISHGSRVSLRYAQKYPQHTASLILDSIYPFEVDAYTDASQYTKQIFSQPFTLCDANPHCRLESGISSIHAFESFMQQIKEKPLIIDVELFDENWNSEAKKLKISPELLAYTLFNNSYDSDAIFEFPFVIKDALKKDYKKLSKLISETIDLHNYTWFSEGAYASYACYEEIPFSNIPLALKNAQESKMAFWNDEELIKLDQQLCKIWNIRPATNDIKTYDYSQLSMPILILAGELDAFTPLKWAINFYNKLPLKHTTQHIRVWPLKAHNLVYDDACVESVMISFLNSPEHTINNDCAITDVSMVQQSGKAKVADKDVSKSD